MGLVVVSLLAVVVGEESMVDAVVPVPDELLMPVVDGLVAPVADPVVDFFIVAAPLSTPVLFAAGGYCGVAPGIVVDSVVVDCASGAPHQTAAIKAPAVMSFIRLFIGISIHSRGFEQEAGGTAFGLRQPVWSSRPRLTLSASTHENRGAKNAAYVSFRTEGRKCRKQHCLLARSWGDSMDGLEVIFLLCTIVWLFVEYL
jgi:hypothetical protein